VLPTSNHDRMHAMPHFGLYLIAYSPAGTSSHR